MSTTSDWKVAVSYSLSDTPLILKIATTSLLNRGADLSFLSAFPSEQEFLYSPNTFLQPTGWVEEIDIGDGRVVKVIEVNPSMP